MSFNKRYINKSKIIRNLDNLDTLFSKKIDVFLFEDVVSEKIYISYQKNPDNLNTEISSLLSVYK